MSGYTVALGLAVFGAVATAVDGVLLHRRARAARAAGVAAERVERQFGFGLLRVAAGAVGVIVLVVVGWQGTDAQQWDAGEVVHEARRIAADLESQNPVPGEPFGETVSFASVVQGEADQFVGDGGRSLTAKQATPQAGAVDAFTVVGSKLGKAGDETADPHPACLVITSARRAPDEVPETAPKSVRVPVYTVRTEVTAGRCG